MALYFLLLSLSKKVNKPNYYFKLTSVCIMLELANMHINPYLSTFFFFQHNSCFISVPLYLPTLSYIYRVFTEIFYKFLGIPQQEGPWESTCPCRNESWSSAALLSFSKVLLQDIYVDCFYSYCKQQGGNMKLVLWDKRCHPALLLSVFISPWWWSPVLPLWCSQH